MSTPILTKKQQRQSLSAKKGPIKGLRNVLAMPHRTYWPILKQDHQRVLEKLLKQLMPVIQRPKAKLLWSELKKMNREQRQKARKESIGEQNILPDKNINDVVTGVNAVTRALENNRLCFILLDANVDPPLLIKHIVTMARNKNVPVVLMSSLKLITLECIGFPCAAVAFKNVVKESQTHHFYALYERVAELHAETQEPNPAVQLFKDENLTNDTLCQKNVKSSKDDVSRVNCEQQLPSISTDVYKYRSSKTERVFKPLNGESILDQGIQDSSDFIAIPDSDIGENDLILKKVKNRRYMNIFENDITTPKKELSTKGNSRVQKATKVNVAYVPLKVKRLQGNSNRIKATKTHKQKRK